LLLAGCRSGKDWPRAIDALQSQGKSREALQLVEKELLHQRPTNRVYWDLALRKAQILEQLNRRQDALVWLHAEARSGGAPADLAVLLVREEAAIESGLGLFREADRHLEEGIARARSSGQSRMAAALAVRHARVRIALDELEKAEQSLSEAEEYVRDSNDTWLVPYILHYRGLVRVARNQFEEGIGPLERSLQGFRDAKQKALAANVVISLAWCYYRLGQIDKALSLYQEALATATPEDRHLALGHLGNISLDGRDFVKAADYYRQAAAGAKGRDQNYYPRWLDNLALALIEQGKWEEAERVDNEVLELEKHIDGSPGLALALVNEGRIETSKGHYEAAKQTLRQVAESREGDPSFALEAYSALAELYARQGKPDEVKRQFEAATALADQVRGRLHEDENKITYLSSLTNVHRKYVEFLVDRGDQRGAFAVAESSRARLLRERLDLPRSKDRSFRIAEYQAASRASGATFLAYWVGPERSSLWAISGTQFASYPLPAEPEIRRLVEQYQRPIERGGSPRPEDAAAGTKLFQLLLPPAVLKRGGRYLIVPDGPLYALNFETLPVPGDRPRFWIEDATVAVAPSLELLLGRQMKPARGRSLLLVGDAAEWNPEYPKLLHARQEMEGIEKLFPAVERRVLAGTEATPVGYQRSKPEDYAYIHFTAHATANKNSPFDSAIILSRENAATSGSGKLSVKEVLSTPVSAELVTISACHSAGARTYWGEGLVGFAWAFLQSGAHGVIAGLWDVSDYSSPRLMQELYAGLAASQSPADALRAAKLALIHSGKYADPYYWGAFQLYEGAL
jgi:CHAT domain-containing protein